MSRQFTAVISYRNVNSSRYKLLIACYPITYKISELYFAIGYQE